MKLNHRKSTIVAALAVAGVSLLGVTPGAHATITLFTGIEGGNQGTDNVLFNPCGTSSGPATTTQGCLNTSHTTLIDITSSENLEVLGGGQARVAGADGGFTNLAIFPDAPGSGFTKLIFNLNASADGTADFTVDQVGEPDVVFSNVALDGNGQNFFTVIASAGEVATAFALTSTVDITDIRQIRIGCGALPPSPPPPPPPPVPEPVPEPGSLLLLGSALVGFGILRRRKRG